MGKASRRKRQQQTGQSGQRPPARAPYVARPFEGLAGETGWVAMREIVPAATAAVRVRPPGGGEPHDVTVVSVLPLAVPALHRADGRVMVALQSGFSSGDASRDVAAAILAALDVEPGTPLRSVATPTSETPRLQDLLTEDSALEVEVHDGFEFWLADDAEPDAATQASLERSNEAAAPTVALTDEESAYWVRMGDRTYVRWLLPQDEDEATTAMARLQAAGTHTLGEGTTLLGAFRACGLLVPVLEVDPEVEPESLTDPLTELATRYREALAADGPLTPEERRARDGLVSRQVTLR